MKTNQRLKKPGKIILGIFSLLAMAISVANAQNISLKKKDISLYDFFKEVKKQTGYYISYSDQEVDVQERLTVDLEKSPLKTALQTVLEKQSLSFNIRNNNITISPQKKEGQQQPSTPKQEVKFVTGTVTTEDNEPLQGVSIRVKDSNIGVFSGKEGVYYILTEKASSVLQFSYVGYQTQEIKLANVPANGTLNVKMKLDIGNLDEVQVQAYSTTSKRLNTGSSVTLTKEEIEKSPSRNVLEILRGQVPGMFIQQEGGLPGSRINVTIRGKSSFQNTEPLLIVDGAIFPLGKLLNGTSIDPTAETVQGMGRTGNGLDFLDPSVIERIDILKDAAATSIYGSRGAYGVIIITTKKGKVGEPVISVRVNSGISMYGASQAMLNTEQFLALRLEALRNDGTPITAQDFDLNGVWPKDRYTDWRKMAFGHQAFTTSMNASYSGGTNDFTYMVGANYRLQGNTQVGKGSVRGGGGHLNLSTAGGRKLTFSLSAQYSVNQNDVVSPVLSPSGVIRMAPNAPSFLKPDGSLNWDDYPSNPFSTMNRLYDSQTNLLNTGLDVSYKPFKGFSLNARLGFNHTASNAFIGEPSTARNINLPFGNRSSIGYSTNRSLLFDPNVAYQTNLGAEGTLSARLGLTMQDVLQTTRNMTGENSLSDALLINPGFGTTQRFFYSQVPERYLGSFGQLSYAWANKYLVDLSARYDGSTRFGPKNRWGLFGSVGLGWIISAEKWFAQAIPFVSFAKLRGSWGTQGGDAIRNYGYLNVFTQSLNYQDQMMLANNELSNPALEWETNTKKEAALELGFLRDRIFTEIAYYHNLSSNQLLSETLPKPTGFISALANSAALIRNNGWEFSVRTLNIAKKDLKWTTSLNISVPRNKLLAYPGLGQKLYNIDFEIGKSVTGRRLIEFAGINPQTGLPNYRNRFGIVKPLTLAFGVDVRDLTGFVDTSPKFFGGIQNNLSYKQFSLDFNVGFTSRTSPNYFSTADGFISRLSNSSEVILNRWQQQGQVALVGKVFSSLMLDPNFINSSVAFSDATYFRLNNVGLSYNLPKTLLEKVKFRNVALRISGSNLLTISRFKGLDPETLSPDKAPLRVFEGSLNITF